MIKRIIGLWIALAILLLMLSGCQNKTSASSIEESDSSLEGNSTVETTCSDPLSSTETEVSGTTEDASATKTKTSANQTTVSNSSTTSSIANPWESSDSSISPRNGSMTATLNPTFKWKKSSLAQSYTIKLEKKSDSSYTTVFEKSGITETFYTPGEQLKSGTTYRYTVYSETSGGKVVMDNFPIVFLSKVDSANHPANVGLDFNFNKTVSKNVLCNYLSRSTVLSIFWDSEAKWGSYERFILNTGAKYIGRAGGSWLPSSAEEAKYSKFKEMIDTVHAIDPDVVFEFCIFEAISKGGIEGISIPDWVFQAFNLPVQSRKFDYESMLFSDGTYVNKWGTDQSVPDITQTETQMFFYYRAVTAINNGFEGIHWGQVELMGQNDVKNKTWTNLFAMVRQYASNHARRGFVFFNAHTHGMYGTDGKLLFDFHSYPSRLYAPDTETAHTTSESNPQITVLKIGSANAIYTKSLGGATYSGWTCDHLPYFVELDNWSGYDASLQDKPGNAFWPWGYDEISWFANQPLSYQKSWLSYAYNWLPSNDSNGYFEMPGMRTSWIVAKKAQQNFYSFSTDFDSYGSGLEDTIRSIWVSSR